MTVSSSLALGEGGVRNESFRRDPTPPPDLLPQGEEGKIVIAAGGTGGHLFPAEALAGELLRRGRRIALLTDARSGATASPVFSGQDRFVLRGAGMAGRGALRAGGAAVALSAGVTQARSLLGRLRPTAVVAFGGYPAVGPVLGARLLRSRPSIVLHEQNAVLGRANRFLARYADLLALSFAQTQRVPAGCRTETTGNPVRTPILDLAGSDYALPEQRICLLVLGGSLGARVFSEVVPAAIASLPDAVLGRLHIVQQCRPEDLDRVRATYAALAIPAELSSFFPDVADRLAAAHVVIARAGASTVAELAIAGRPAVLVPLPGAIDDHQTANAAALTAAGGAVLIAQPDFTPAVLCARLAAWLSEPDRLAQAAAATRSLARPDASVRLADAVEAVIRQEARMGDVA
ncbi:MAG TPA: undecaprenyldiphospho-muramoylpentapeptide beta-N-acetylglucosaminyltransferase [Acetobacteraceae bacterium]|nr:undecaprenyldiphospho-muramoylpentapeptide beta-N-acetylglucosaminyltransferase [Acetobacteraceae bacterium]